MFIPSIFANLAQDTSTSGTAGSSTTSSSTANPPASNVLGPNSFITLLTAQLQAQDPLNPLDPNQMVDELTSMNTLQQTIQIRQDLDGLLAAAQGKAPATTAATAANAVTGTSANSSAIARAIHAVAPNLFAVSGSPAAISAAKEYSRAKLQSKFF